MVHRGRGKQRSGGSKHPGGGRGNAGGLGYNGLGNRFVRPEAHASVDGRPFSLWDEARNTEKHHGVTTTRLRDMKISFVAAGSLEPSELLKPMVREPRDVSEVEDDNDDEMDETRDMDLDEEQDSPVEKTDPMEEEAIVRELDMSTLHLHMKSSRPEASSQKMEDLEPQNGTRFVLDLTGDVGLIPKVDIPVQYHPRASSPTSSGSEEIVFVPRGKKGTASTISRPSPPKSPPPKKSETSHWATRDRVVQVVTTQQTVVTHLPSKPEEKEIEKAIDSPKLLSQFNAQRATPGNKRRKRRRRQKADYERPAIEDYLENIAAQERAEADEDGAEASGTGDQFKPRDIGGDEWADESSTDKDEAASDSDAVRGYKNYGWSKYELEDFNDISTDEEGMRGPVDTILGKRQRPSGLQYLIKWDGYETDDATWVLQEIMDSSADIKVKQFEEHGTIEIEDSEDSDSDDENGAMDADEDSDRRLAEIFQYHEELGMGMGIDLDDEIMGLDDDFFPMGVGKRYRGKGKKKRQMPPELPNRRTGLFPSASRFADACDSFDILDRMRPSIAKPRKKGKGKIAPNLNLSDEELAATISNTWARDREKKKLRKIEREELRSQGLLGKKARETGKPNLNDKYSEGITLTEVFDEIRAFMLRDHDSLALPPMDSHDRKVIHELANTLHLKSKSVGAGKKRFPTLTKTQRSAYFEGDEEGIDAILRHRTFLKRTDVRSGGGKKTGGGKGGGRGGGRGGGAAGGTKRRDGEVVGGDAPELGLDNRGRLMLEKMGYKTGMSLGAEHNKGIVVPVVAVVKVSKAGLG